MSFRVRRLALPILVGVVVPLLLAGSALAELKDGEVLSSENWQEGAPFLPDEITNHYRNGDYRTPLADLSTGKYKSLDWPTDFRDATAANRGKYTIGPEGNIVNVSDGKPAGFIYGAPFPDIDPKDPEAARKVVWNYFYNRWFDGNGHFYSQLGWLSRGVGLERNFIVDAYFLYYQGWKEARQIPNPLNLLIQNLGTVVEPADVNGTATLSWRFLDAKKHDANWAYVPALRRVRQTSPTNRSDGVLGSDLAADDGQYFDAKPEDWDFKLLGEQDMYGLVDRGALEGETQIKPVKGGGYRFVWDDKPWFAYDKPGTPGAPWAPMESRFVKGRYWVIEAVPKDRYYLYGKIILRFDEKTMRGSYSSKYSWKNELLASYQVQNGVYWSPDGGKTGHVAGRSVYQVAENVKLDRATAVRFDRNPANPADYKVPLDASMFDSQALVKAGK